MQQFCGSMATLEFSRAISRTASSSSVTSPESGPFYVEVTPQSDGSLQLQIASFHHTQNLLALRPAGARARNLAPPDDPTHPTKGKVATQPLRFSFPDGTGRIVSNPDDRTSSGLGRFDS